MIENVLRLLVVIFLILPGALFSQTNPCEFPELVPFCLYSKPFRLSKIAGRVFDKDRATMPDSCAALFNKQHTLVASAITDDSGEFALAPVPPGSYLLVVTYGYPGFTPAIASVVVDSRGSSKKVNVQMVLSGIDTCSVVNLK